MRNAATRDQPWISPASRKVVVQHLVEFGLIEHDPAGQIELVGGTKTDLKLELRRGRNDPRALTFVSKLFHEPLGLINPDRFAEVPLSMSCYCGLIAVQSQLPFVTIRDSAKRHHSDSLLVGKTPFKGEHFVIIDDAITDGQSKIGAIKYLQAHDAIVEAVIVLVDREEGWREKFEKAGLSDIQVWAGMTLGQLRNELGLPENTPAPGDFTEAW